MPFVFNLVLDHMCISILHFTDYSCKDCEHSWMELMSNYTAFLIDIEIVFTVIYGCKAFWDESGLSVRMCWDFYSILRARVFINNSMKYWYVYLIASSIKFWEITIYLQVSKMCHFASGYKRPWLSIISSSLWLLINDAFLLSCLNLASPFIYSRSLVRSCTVRLCHSCFPSIFWVSIFPGPLFPLYAQAISSFPSYS